MTTMTTATGTCAYCGHEGETLPASLQPGSTLRQCADKRACTGRMDAGA